MFGLFKKKSQRDKLMEKYNKLTEEAYRLSHTDRKASDLKTAEAQEVLKELEALESDE
ncbi:MAG: Lacal_2735 family protein [Bacteroidota bacterium]